MLPKEVDIGLFVVEAHVEAGEGRTDHCVDEFLHVGIGVGRRVAAREGNTAIDQHKPLTPIGVLLGGVGNDETAE